MRELPEARKFYCPVDGFQQMISGKYKLRLLWSLRDRSLRYSELMNGLGDTRNLKPIAPRVLSRELKALAYLGLVARKDFRTLPLRVEYALTELGQSLLPTIGAMHAWSVKHLVKTSALKAYAKQQAKLAKNC